MARRKYQGTALLCGATSRRITFRNFQLYARRFFGICPRKTIPLRPQEYSCNRPKSAGLASRDRIRLCFRSAGWSPSPRRPSPIAQLPSIPNRARAALIWGPRYHLTMKPASATHDIFYILSAQLNFAYARRHPNVSAQKRRCPAQLRGAYSIRTVKGYSSDLRIFQEWCAKHSEPWLPAHSKAIAAFVDDQIERHCISTIKRRLCAIAFVHRLQELPVPTMPTLCGSLCAEQPASEPAVQNKF